MAKRWVYWLLFGATLALVALSASLQLRRSETADDPRTSLELTLLAKMALAGTTPGLPMDAYEAPFLAKLELAEKDPSPRERARALRRKALWCSYRERDCTAPALDALGALSPEDRLPAPADETALLREILTGDLSAPDPAASGQRPPAEASRVSALESRLPELRLGWFNHLLRERLYRRSGDTARADESLASARRGAYTALAALLGLTALLGAGVLAWLILLVHPARARILARLGERLRIRIVTDPGEPARNLLVVLVFLAVSVALSLLSAPLGLAGLTSPVPRALLTVGIEVLLLVLVLVTHVVFVRLTGSELGYRKTSPLRALGVGALAYLLLWPVLLAVMIPLSRLFDRLGLPTRSHPIVGLLQAASDTPLAMALWFFVAVVMAPLLEEAVFRGALQGAAQPRFGGRWALFLTAALFAIIHPQVGLGLMGVFLIGLALSIVRAHEDTLWPGVVLHALNNGVALLLATALLSS